MSGLMSIDKQISDLHFKPFPTKSTGIKRIARTNGVIVATTESGILYTNNRELCRKVYWTSDRNAFFDDVAVCLRKLGVITPDQVKVHKEWSIKVGDRRDARRRYRNIVRAMKDSGLQISQSQRKKLQAAAGIDASDHDEEIMKTNY